MKLTNLLIANRGEIAIRIIRGASEMGLKTVAIYSEDEAEALHIRKADEAHQLEGSGARAYLDIEQILSVAKSAGCDAIHPGYGFLSENTQFARRCEEEGIRWVGPRPETLELFGDKVQARALAVRAGVPVLPGTDGPITVEDAKEFLTSLGEGKSMMIKAVGGGGGRGARSVENLEDVEQAFKRCQSEATAAFGNGALYAEQFLPKARHIEVQVIGDGSGAVSHLWERECTIQRRYQKVVEIAPSPGLPGGLRQRLTAAAVRLAEEAHYDNLGTFEFLVDATNTADDSEFAFIEVNPRLQVEHTVTEEVVGIDLIRVQIELASGKSLHELGLLQAEVPPTRGFAIQSRINLETMTNTGRTKPSSGTLTAFEIPSGPGLRTDTFGYVGYKTTTRFDSLLAKVIAHTPSDDFADAAAKMYRALREFRIEGVETNIPWLLNLMLHPQFVGSDVHTRFVEEHVAELVTDDETVHRKLYYEPVEKAEQPEADAAPQLAGVKVDASDPLAVLDYGKGGGPPSRSEAARSEPTATRPDPESSDGTTPVRAPLQGTIVQVDAKQGDVVRAGEQLLVMEAMKMEHVITADTSGLIRRMTVAAGDAVYEGHVLAFIEEMEVEAEAEDTEQEVDLDLIRPDLEFIHDRHAVTLDAARPEAVARRRRTKQRTARENIDDLCDDGSFVEYGSLVLTPRTGLPLDEVVRKFPTDGIITGVGKVNADLFDGPTSRTAVLSYDYTVLAGTQGPINHAKTDRLLRLAERWMLPVIFYTEGGGGRAGTGGNRTGGEGKTESGEGHFGAAFDGPTFTLMGRLSGLVPTVGVNSGFCFAGNAAVLGACDVVIATEDSNIGMGGPAMIEGGGLGVFRPEEIGPLSVQLPAGVVDIAVRDEEEATKVAKQYLSYFQGPVEKWEAPDQRLLRSIIPENRLRIYDVREVIDSLADVGSVLELRRHYGLGMVTAFIRIEGRTVGVLANNPSHLAGAIDSDGSDKAARFMQLCDAYDIPLLVLCDTPGIMVGPEIEKTGLVRHSSRLFVTGANVTIPIFLVVLRKAYGLGALAMAGGDFKVPYFATAWPTAEFGGMGLEGQVKLGFRNELAAIEDPEKRLGRYQELVDMAYERGRAIHQAVGFGVDDVIDPADTRQWLQSGLESVPLPAKRTVRKRTNIDTW